MQNNWGDRFSFFYILDINKQDIKLTSGDNVKSMIYLKTIFHRKKIKMRVFCSGNFQIQLGRNVAFNAYFYFTYFVPLFG